MKITVTKNSKDGLALVTLSYSQKGMSPREAQEIGIDMLEGATGVIDDRFKKMQAKKKAKAAKDSGRSGRYSEDSQRR